MADEPHNYVQCEAKEHIDKMRTEIDRDIGSLSMIKWTIGIIMIIMILCAGSEVRIASKLSDMRDDDNNIRIELVEVRSKFSEIRAILDAQRSTMKDMNEDLREIKNDIKRFHMNGQTGPSKSSI